MVDVTPLIPAGRQVIDSYGNGGFKVSGARYEGSILVLPDRTIGWDVTSFDQVTLESLAPLLEDVGVELLLVGCGPRLTLVPGALRRELKAAGVGVESMDTGAACRTYNVLLAEGRRVAAALIAVG